MAKKDKLEYVKFHWKGSDIYRFSRSVTRNFLCQSTMVADIFEDFEPHSKKFLATPLVFFVSSFTQKQIEYLEWSVFCMFSLFMYLFIYCVCVKRVMLCNCLCSSPFSRFSARLIGDIREFGAKIYFNEHRTTNTIKLFVPIKRKFLGSILFLNKSQQREFHKGYLTDVATCLFAHHYNRH